MSAAVRPSLSSLPRFPFMVGLRTLMFAFGVLAAREAVADASPEAAARGFYDRVIALRIAGVPDRNQQRQLAPAISSSLARALRTAEAAERAHRKATRNREPPLFEGDIFTSLFEGAREATVERCRADAEHAQCAVSLVYRDHFGATQRWQDRVVLVRERGRWVVDDIAYEARWAFGNKGTLRANLRDAAPQPESAKAARPARKPSAKARANATSAAGASRDRGR